MRTLADVVIGNVAGLSDEAKSQYRYFYDPRTAQDPSRAKLKLPPPPSPGVISTIKDVKGYCEDGICDALPVDADATTLEIPPIPSLAWTFDCFKAIREEAVEPLNWIVDELTHNIKKNFIVKDADGFEHYTRGSAWVSCVEDSGRNSYIKNPLIEGSSYVFDFVCSLNPYSEQNIISIINKCALTDRSMSLDETNIRESQRLRSLRRPEVMGGMGIAGVYSYVRSLGGILSFTFPHYTRADENSLVYNRLVANSRFYIEVLDIFGDPVYKNCPFQEFGSHVRVEIPSNRINLRDKSSTIMRTSQTRRKKV